MLIWGARVFFSCITRRTSTTGRAQSSCSRPAVTRPFVTPAAGGAAMDLAAAPPPTLPPRVDLPLQLPPTSVVGRCFFLIRAGRGGRGSQQKPRLGGPMEVGWSSAMLSEDVAPPGPRTAHKAARLARDSRNQRDGDVGSIRQRLTASLIAQSTAGNPAGRTAEELADRRGAEAVQVLTAATILASQPPLLRPACKDELTAAMFCALSVSAHFLYTFRPGN